MYIIHTNNIHISEERREQARRGKREERREERGMERRREERLAMGVLVPQFPERSALGKTRGEEGALMRKAGLEFNTSVCCCSG